MEFCRYELKGGSCKEYSDKGYSGKNTERPKFQELVRDIEQGLIDKVIVYKLDRISRSILDFANMMENRCCEGAGKLIAAETEAFIYAAMVRKLKPFQTLHGRNETLKSNPKLAALRVELAKVESEIETLINTLTGASQFCYRM